MLWNDPYIDTGLIVLAALASWVLLTSCMHHLRKSGHPLAATLDGTRNFLVPIGTLLYFLIFIVHISTEGRLIKVIETVFWIVGLWILLSLVKVFVFSRAKGVTWRARVPGLFLDLARAGILVFGACLVVAGVWNRDLGGFLATLGLGSIVLGLALQDTLGNLFAGIALLFERPFNVGDWIEVGNTIGRVTEVNWRAVRLITWNHDIMTVPNSVLGKERIQNFSRPSSVQGIEVDIAFSYQDPPNTVKRVLHKIASETRGIVSEPRTTVRTQIYGDFSINYHVRLFIDDFDRMQEIKDDFMTQIWYAARRNKLTIPYPIRTVHKTEMPFHPAEDLQDEIRQAIRLLPLFVSLSADEIELLTQNAVVQDFARGERIIYEGDTEDALYILQSGRALVSFGAGGGAEHEVARLSKGDFFGEMALLTGEERSANVTALEDVVVVVIFKDAVGKLLSLRPNLAEEISEVVEARRRGLSEAKDQARLSAQTKAEIKQGANALLERIRNFFGI